MEAQAPVANVADVMNVEALTNDPHAAEYQSTQVERHKDLWGAGEIVEFDRLDQIPLPEETKTYVPVPHKDFVQNVSTFATDILGPKGFKQTTMQIITHKEGARLFGIMEFANGLEDMRFMVACRNSYDKSMKAAIAAGGRVICCSNLMINGEIVVMHKHTGNVLEFLKRELIIAFHTASATWTNLETDVKHMQRVTMSDEDAYGMLGRAAVAKVITPIEVLKVADVWDRKNKGARFDYGDNTMYRWYNCVTQLMRPTPPQQIIQRHQRLHQFATTTHEFNHAAPF